MKVFSYPRKKLRILTIILVVIMLSVPVFSPTSSSSARKIRQSEPSQEQEGFNITIENITFSKEAPKEGENVSIFINIRNNESRDINNVNITLMHFDKMIFFWDNVTMKTNSTKTLEFVWKAESGLHSFTAMMAFNIRIKGRVIEIPMGRQTNTLKVNPNAIGDVYYPLGMLGLISLFILGMIVAPACINRISGGSSTRKKRNRGVLEKKD